MTTPLATAEQVENAVPTSKVCSKCGVDKPLSEFYKQIR